MFVFVLTCFELFSLPVNRIVHHAVLEFDSRIRYDIIIIVIIILPQAV